VESFRVVLIGNVGKVLGRDNSPEPPRMNPHGGLWTTIGNNGQHQRRVSGLTAQALADRRGRRSAVQRIEMQTRYLRAD
jgi:hypothetical protein